MPFIDSRGKPLDPDHPFATPRIIFGAKRPAPSPTPSTSTSAAAGSGWTEEEMAHQVRMGKAVDDYVKKLNDEDRRREQSVSAAPTSRNNSGHP